MGQTARNWFEVDTPWGYQSIELYEGDILGLEAPVDILVASAAVRYYEPQRGTLFHSLLERLGIDVRVEAQNPRIDLRDPLSVWLSQPLRGGPFGALACVELHEYRREPKPDAKRLETALRNLFGLLSMAGALGFPARTVAMPVLGSGDQGLPVEIVLPILVRLTEQALRENASLQRVQFVELNPVRAAALDCLLDQVLGRKAEHVRPVASRAGAGRLDPRLLARLVGTLGRLRSRLPAGSEAANVAGTLEARIRDRTLRFLDLARDARILAECFTADLLRHAERASTDLRSLNRDIGMLWTRKLVPEWVGAYLHVLRVIGNAGVHVSDAAADLGGADHVVAGLACLERVLDFWAERRREEP
jgi:O-acetyl-ADP-ribose deacetylase (regulator of RNase III)